MRSLVMVLVLMSLISCVQPHKVIPKPTPIITTPDVFLHTAPVPINPFCYPFYNYGDGETPIIEKCFPIERPRSVI